MTDELLPCPFCGGQAEMRESSTHDFYVKCKDCGAATRRNHENRNGAVMDWNARAERTCRMETAEGCQNWNSCSECDADYYTDQPINYCPNCGAKVMNA